MIEARQLALKQAKAWVVEARLARLGEAMEFPCPHVGRCGFFLALS
jgi:hypothetical protein